MANPATQEEAKREFEYAYTKATNAYGNQNLSFEDRTLALKVTLVSIKMLYEKWERLWDREIAKYFRTSEVKRAIVNRTGEEYVLIVNFAGVLRSVPLESQSCPDAVAEVGNVLNAKDTSGFTALHTACKNGKYNYLKALIDAGADPNATDFSGSMILHMAARDGKLDCLQVLIDGKADLNANDLKGRTPIHLAVKTGKIECVQALIDAGADINAHRNDFWTGLHYAAYWNQAECMKALIKAGANLNKPRNDGWTALHLAAHWKRIECVIQLVEGGADLFAKDIQGRTALDVAKTVYFNGACINYLEAKMN